MTSSIGSFIPASPMRQEQAVHAGLRSSAMPRRGSTGNMQLTNYSPGSKRKTRQEPAASATEDHWVLDLQFLRSKTSLCAHVRAMRSAQLAEVEKQLSIDAAEHTLQTRKWSCTTPTRFLEQSSLVTRFLDSTTLSELTIELLKLLTGTEES
eukprot:SAG11_NODE_289_length_11184_cov_20.648083_3_plen_152_part_00